MKIIKLILFLIYFNTYSSQKNVISEKIDHNKKKDSSIQHKILTLLICSIFIYGLCKLIIDITNTIWKFKNNPSLQEVIYRQNKKRNNKK